MPTENSKQNTENKKQKTVNWKLRGGKWLVFAFLLLLLLLMGSGCAVSEPEAKESELVLKLTLSAIPPTIATEEEAGEPETTPETPDDLAATATTIAIENKKIAEAEATKKAGEEVDAFATEIPIRKELATYGYTEGLLTGIYQPISLEQTVEGDYDFHKPSFAAHARDFVIVADVTWDASSEDSGCGFVVRSDGNEEALNQYVTGVARNGNLLFTEQLNGEIDDNRILEFDVASKDPNFNGASGGTNRLAIVGRGQDFTYYSNGQLLTTITAQNGLEDGFVTFIAVNDSGGVRCDFNNAWLWELN